MFGFFKKCCLAIFHQSILHRVFQGTEEVMVFAPGIGANGLKKPELSSVTFVGFSFKENAPKIFHARSFRAEFFTPQTVMSVVGYRLPRLFCKL
jgi:hypothetical protein